MSNTINKDVILSLKNVDGLFEIEESSIKHPQEILNKLDEIEDNVSIYSVFSIQKYANSLLLEKDEQYSYCWPNEYKDSFVSKAKFPEEIDRDKYNKELENIEDKEKMQFAIKYTKDPTRKNKIYLPDYEKQLTEAIEKKKSEFARKESIKLIEQLRRYIFAQCYTKSLADIKATAWVYSCESIGWYKPSFNVSGFARISLSTNFCYGRAAYFHVNLNYKGINILPYSHLVEYYWSNMMDNIRHTRLYYPYRENWNDVMDFIRDICNWIEKDSVSFEQKWIIEEVEKMMKGLKSINEEIDKYYEQLTEAMRIDNERRMEMRKQNIIPKESIVYRHIDIETVWKNKIYPHETKLTIQVDKLSAALSLLENLTALKNIYEPVVTHIDTIIQYNAKVVPAIDVACKEIHKKIADLKKKEKNVEFSINRNQIEINKRKKLLERLLEKENPKYRVKNLTQVPIRVEKTDKEHQDDREYNKLQQHMREWVLEKQCQNDKEYKKCQDNLEELQQTLSKLKEEERNRQDFYDHLTARKEYIVGRLEKWQKII